MGRFVLFLTKAEQLSLFGPRKEVEKPGSRGGKGYYDEHGKWQYGERPAGSVFSPSPEQPKEEPLPPTSKPEDEGEYAYKDVGYVAGSRKELAQQAIRVAARQGKQVHWQDIDWQALEENPRAAAELVKKGSVFGVVDWPTLAASGMDPGAGYLIKALYASVATEPDTADLRRRLATGGADTGSIHEMKGRGRPEVLAETAELTAQARQDYVRGINTLRERMEACRTVDAVLKTVGEITAERDGTMLGEGESDRHRSLTNRLNELRRWERNYRATMEPLSKQANFAAAEKDRAKWEQGKRKDRGWKPDPELDAEVKRLEQRNEEAWAALTAAHDRPKEEVVREEYSKIFRERAAIETKARLQNLKENVLTRAWHTLGDRFAGALGYRSDKGSGAFAKNVTLVRAGKIKDWSWAESEEKSKEKVPTQESVRFQLLVADSYDRVGGRPAPVASSADLQQKFNLRAVQSGNWVLRDETSGKFHMEQCAAAFSDLADVIGIQDSDVSLEGRLAMAFGARGKGGAKAHYEPVERVINITKMAGAGSLAHEWFHALDNLMIAAYGAEGVDLFASELPEQNSKLPASVQQAAAELHAAMTEGNVREQVRLDADAEDDKLVALNMTPERTGYGSGWRQTIGRAASLEHAMAAIDAMHAANRFGRGTKGARQYNAIRRIAAAWWTKDQAGTKRSVTVPRGKGVSQYLVDARELNAMGSGFGKPGYWSQVHEMSARAFAAYASDKLKDSGRRNDYLSFRAENRFYLAGRPYPEGEERRRINAAFDQLFEALRGENAFAKAAAVLTGASWWQRIIAKAEQLAFEFARRVSENPENTLGTDRRGRKHWRSKPAAVHSTRLAEVRAELDRLDRAVVLGPGFTPHTQARHDALAREIAELEATEKKLATAPATAAATIKPSDLALMVRTRRVIQDAIRGATSDERLTKIMTSRLDKLLVDLTRAHGFERAREAVEREAGSMRTPGHIMGQGRVAGISNQLLESLTVAEAVYNALVQARQAPDPAETSLDEWLQQKGVTDSERAEIVGVEPVGSLFWRNRGSWGDRAEHALREWERAHRKKQRDAVEARRTELATHNLVKVSEPRGRQKWIVISRDTHPDSPGWRATEFDEDGVYGHEAGATREQALDRALGGAEAHAAPGDPAEFQRVSMTERFLAGTRNAGVMQAINALGYHGKYEQARKVQSAETLDERELLGRQYMAELREQEAREGREGAKPPFAKAVLPEFMPNCMYLLCKAEQLSFSSVPLEPLKMLAGAVPTLLFKAREGVFKDLWYTENEDLPAAGDITKAALEIKADTLRIRLAELDAEIGGEACQQQP